MLSLSLFPRGLKVGDCEYDHSWLRVLVIEQHCFNVELKGLFNGNRRIRIKYFEDARTSRPYY